MKIYFVALLSFLSLLPGLSQAQADISNLPVNIIASVTDTSKPLVLYISGDGGWNNFSQELTKGFAAMRYPVISLNANKYFWKKKTPEQIASDVSALVKNYLKLWNRKKLVLVGYSFGADVMPFVYSHLPKDIALQVENISLLSPSSTTDFEIHVMVMLGKRGLGQSVPAAINKITDKPIIIIFGDDEDGYKSGELTGKNFSVIKLAGGHHYDGDEDNVVKTIIQHFPKNY